MTIKKMKKNQNINQLNVIDNNAENIVLAQDYKKRLFYWMMLFFGSLLLTAASLTINYLVYSTSKKGGQSFSFNSETIVPFIIVIFFLVLAIIYGVLYFAVTLKQEYNDKKQKRLTLAAIGFTGGFADTIAVGSFGVVTGLMKATKTITNDTKLPGTLNIGLGISVLVESSLFVGSIEIDMTTLIILVVTVVTGTYIGSLFVSKIKDPKFIKIVVGVFLLIVGIFMILTHPHVGAIQTTNIGDHKSLMDKPWRIILGVIIFFLLGIVQSFGIGIYAPSLAIFSFLGLDQEVIYPIMACGSALSMIAISFNFIRQKQYLQLSTNLIAIFSIIGVNCAFLIVFVGLKMGLNMDDVLFNAILKWIAIVVIFYVAITMLYEYYHIIKTKKKA